MSLLRITALFVLSSLCTSGLHLSAKSKGEHKIVFLHGGRSHASGDHEFQAGSHLLANHLNAQKKVNLKAVVNGWPSDESMLDDADSIVIYADGTSVIGKGWNKMEQLVKNKKVGVVFMHYAVHPVWTRVRNTSFHGLVVFSKTVYP